MQDYININININIIDYSEIPFSNKSYHIETIQLIFFAKQYRNYKNMTVQNIRNWFLILYEFLTQGLSEQTIIYTKLKRAIIFCVILLYLQFTMKLFSNSPYSKENKAIHFLNGHLYFLIGQHGELNTADLILTVKPCQTRDVQSQ